MPGLSVLATDLTWSLQGAGAPAAALGQLADIYRDMTTGELYEKLVAGWVKLLYAGSEAVTLQEAYDGGGTAGAGAGRSVTNMTGGAALFQSSAANDNNVFEIVKSPAGAQSGAALALSNSATATGAALAIATAGSGDAVTVIPTGSGGGINVAMVGSGIPFVAAGPNSSFTNSGANNSGVLAVNKSPVGAQSGNALTVTNTASATGAGINLNILGSGVGVNIAVPGPGAALRIADTNGTEGNFIEAADGAAAAVSGANTGRIRYNATTDTWQVSENGGAYRNIPVGSYTQDVKVPALGFTLSETAFPGLIESGTTVKRAMLAFDATADESANFTISVPTDITSGTVTFRVYGIRASGTSAANVAFNFKHCAVADGETLDGSYTTVASGDLAVNTSATTLDVFTWTETVTNLGWTGGELLACILQRIDASASNLGVDLYVALFTVSIPCLGA